MERLATFLAGPDVRLGRPVVDKTGLDGAFNFDLDWTPEGTAEIKADAPPSIFVAPGTTWPQAGDAKESCGSGRGGSGGEGLDRKLK
jgi:uncharacterized protein (TIGR03435 family)